MDVVGELCTSRLCSSRFFVVFFTPPLSLVLRLIIIFFYVHPFDA